MYSLMFRELFYEFCNLVKYMQILFFSLLWIGHLESWSPATAVSPIRISIPSCSQALLQESYLVISPIKLQSHNITLLK
jgi:hypothetical protein